MIRFLIIFSLLGTIFSIYSCGRGQTLLIKNVTEMYDTLPVRVKINHRMVFDGNVKRTNVSLDYYEERFSVNDDSICVDVELPTLRMSKQSCSMTEQGKLVVVTINEIVSQVLDDSIIKANSMNQDNIMRKVPKISIAFLKQKLVKVQ